MSKSKPESEVDVFEVMQQYCQKKGYSFSNTQLDYLAQDCYLYFESRGWKGIAYWPAVAMRWVLQNLERSYKAKPDKQSKSSYKPELPKGKSIRDTILESEAEQEND